MEKSNKKKYYYKNNNKKYYSKKKRVDKMEEKVTYEKLIATERNDDLNNKSVGINYNIMTIVFVSIVIMAIVFSSLLLFHLI